jgi:ribosomal protein S18 acetylase RimI-like enzyme
MRARGAAEVATMVGHRLKEELWSRDVLVMFERPADLDPIAQEGLEFRVATATDADDYARDIGTDSAATFRARLSDATRCVVVVRNDRLVHASWITTAAAWTRELRRYLHPPTGDAYIYESFTAAAARGLGIYPFALRNIVALLRAEERGTAWVAVEADNAASLRAVTKAGFEEAFRIPYVRRLGVLKIGRPSGPAAEIARSFMSVKPVPPGL